MCGKCSISISVLEQIIAKSSFDMSDQRIAITALTKSKESHHAVAVVLRETWTEVLKFLESLNKQYEKLLTSEQKRFRMKHLCG